VQTVAAGDPHAARDDRAVGSRVLGAVLVRVDVVAGDAASAPVLGVEGDPPDA
jgi:hypothetical protein